MARTYDALLRAERARGKIGDAASIPASLRVTELEEEMASLRVAVYALEDRMEIELPALAAELHQAISKLEQSVREHAAGRSMREPLPTEQALAGLRLGLERIDRHVVWIVALASVALLLVLLRA